MVAFPTRISAHRSVWDANPRLAAIAIGVAVWIPLSLAFAQGGRAPGWMQFLNITRDLAGELFVVAAVACLIRWRMTREEHALRSGIALSIVGLTIPASASLVPWTSDGVHAGPAAAVVRVALFIPVFLVLAAQDRPAAAPSRSRTGTSAMVVAVPVLGVGILAGILGGSLTSMTAQRAVACAVELTAALTWLLLGVARQRRCGQPTDNWSAFAMFLMAAGELSRLAILAGLHTSGLALWLQLGAAATVAYAATSESLSSYRSHRTTSEEIWAAATSARSDLEQLTEQQRERLHDARSTVFGVLGAHELLASPTPPPGLDRPTLQRLITEELRRLQFVLDGRSVEPLVEFDLVQTLGPVLLSHRVAKAPVESDLADLRVTGRPLATATVLDNLLRNAQVHAPGATVTVRAHLVDDTVAVVVEDDGPGIPFAERDTVLLPGVCGSRAISPGAGLGLYVAARAMSNQGGLLRVGGRQGGGTRVTITLPVAGGRTPLASVSREAEISA